MLDSLINLLRKLAKFAGNPQSSDHVGIREELPGNWLPWVESLPFYSTLTEAAVSYTHLTLPTSDLV